MYCNIESTAHVIPSADHTGNYALKLNDITVKTESWSLQSQEAHNETGLDIDKSYKAEGIFNISFMDGTHVFINVEFYTDANVLLETVSQNVQVGTYHLVVFHNRRTEQKVIPSYLEELHKLDRTSSSHYIPR